MSPALGLVAGETEKIPAVLDSGSLLARVLATEGAEFTHTSYGHNDGLPAATVRALQRTPDGYLWIGTFGGLTRFDGARFDRFRAAEWEGLFSDRITALTLDDAGDLWIGTQGGGVSVLRDGRFEEVLPRDVCTIVTSIVHEPGRMWVTGDGLHLFDAQGRREIVLAGPEEPRAFTVGIRAEEEGEGEVESAAPEARREIRHVVFATNGIHRLRGERHERVSERATHGSFVDTAGNVWAVLDGGDVVAPLANLAAVRSAPKIGTVYTEVPHSQDRNLLATQYGLVAVEGAGDRMRLVEITSDVRPRAILPYEKTHVWVGTRRNGLISLEPAPYRQPQLVPSRLQPSIDTVVAGEDLEVLVGAIEGPEAWVFDGTDVRALESVEGPPLDEFFTAVPLPVTGFLVLDAHGLAHVIDGRVHRVLARHHLTEVPARRGGLAGKLRLLPGPGQSAWLWNGGALTRLDDHCVPVATVESAGPMPSYGFPVRDGLVFFQGDLVRHCAVTSDALGAQAPPTDVVRIDGADLRAGLEDERGDLWISTYGQGLYRLTPGGRLDHWTAAEGLVDDYLGWIGSARDADQVPRLWMNSNSGVFAVTFESLEGSLGPDRAHLITQRLGTPETNGPQGGFVRGGALAFPTVDGLVVVDPGDVRLEERPPHVVFQGVSVDGRPYDPKAEYHSGVDLEIDYTGIDFPSSRRVVFEHRLEGFDDEWVAAGMQRSARYPKLPPGRYRFRVRARAEAGLWSEPVTALEGRTIQVQPRWFQRAGIHATVLGLVGLVGFGVFRLRTRVLRRRSQWMAQEIARRRAIQEELARSRSEHVAVLDTAYDGILSVDRHFTIVLANEAIGHMLGRWGRPIVGRGLDQVGLGDLRVRIAEALRGAAIDGPGPSFHSLDGTIERADGTVADVECTFAWDLAKTDVLADGDGHSVPAVPDRLTIVVRDVSEKRTMVEALRRGEERFRTLFRTIPTAVLVWRPSLQIVDWNDSAASIFGLADNPESPPLLLDLFPASERIESFRLAIERALGGAQRVSIVQNARDAEGDQRRFRWTFAPLFHDDGSIRSVITLASDITEDERVAHDLEALRRKVVRAEETERSRIARELHDDLSQRLAALALDLQMLSQAEGLRGDEQRDGVTRVKNGIEEVARDVHDLSRKLHPTVLDDLGLPRALRSECERRSRQHQIEVDFYDRTDGVVPEPEVSLALFRIAQESLQNACKHADPSRIEVHLERAPYATIRLTVHDDGDGFDSETTRGTTSSGLGIASMEERARLVGAELTLRSLPGSGTMVTVVAPIGGAEARTLPSAPGHFPG